MAWTLFEIHDTGEPPKGKPMKLWKQPDRGDPGMWAWRGEPPPKGASELWYKADEG